MQRCLSPGLAKTFSARRMATSISCDARGAGVTSATLARSASSHFRKTRTLSSAAARDRRCAVARKKVAPAFVPFAAASASLLTWAASPCLREASRVASESAQLRVASTPTRGGQENFAHRGAFCSSGPQWDTMEDGGQSRGEWDLRLKERALDIVPIGRFRGLQLF